jgi:5-methylcytosine-specific restriction endonuclease McrA
MGDYVLSGIGASTPIANFNWKRFWNLFISYEDLNEQDRAELMRLKRELQEIHSSLEREERRKAQELHRAIQVRLSRLGINDDRSVYIVHRGDYKRGSEKERDYIRQHRNYLFRIYDNRCSKCGNDANGLDIDHFFISKNEGGCFQMLHRDGFIVNNAIPLCESCNRSKSDRDYRSFFSQHDLIRVLELNSQMNLRLNQERVKLCRTYR